MKTRTRPWAAIGATCLGAVMLLWPAPPVSAGLGYGPRMLSGKLKPEYEIVHVSGFNPDVDTAEETIWAAGGTFPGFVTAASAVEAISTDADDTDGGSGAQTILVEGLDENWAAASETLTMAGLSASTASATTFIRINHVHVATAGTYHGSNEGTITIRDEDDSPVRADILHDGTRGFGQSEQAIYSVPAGKIAHITYVHLAVDSSKKATIYLWELEGADDVATPFASVRLLEDFPAISGVDQTSIGGDIRVDEKSDIWITAVGGQTDTPIAAAFGIMLERK